MTTLEKLKLIHEMEQRNAERSHQYKNAKQWQVTFACIDKNGIDEEENEMLLRANTISDVIKEAEEMLAKAAVDLSWQKWAIWNVGMIDEDIF